MKKLFLLLFILTGIYGYSQQKDSLLLERPDTNMVQEKGLKILQTFNIDAKVIGVLAGTSQLAVLQIISADKNNCSLHAGDEILVKFYFGLKPVEGELNLPCIKADQIIMGEVFCTDNINTIQKDYTIMRYSTIPEATKE